MSRFDAHSFPPVLLLLALAATTTFLSSCSDDPATEPEPAAPVFTEEVYDSLVLIGDEEAPTYWDERDQLGREQAIQNLADRLSNRSEVTHVFPPGDALLFYAHSSGLLSAIATDTIAAPVDPARVSGRADEPRLEPSRVLFRATMFDYPSWLGLPSPVNPSADVKAVLDGSALFSPIGLQGFSYANLSALRSVPKDSKFIYFFPLHGDGSVFTSDRCGTIGPFMQLDHIAAWGEVDAVTQSDVDQCRILLVRGPLLTEIWLTNHFLNAYFKDFTRYPLVMVSACNLLSVTDALWNSIKDGGAGALVGYSATMTVADAHEWEPYLMTELVADRTLAEARQAVSDQFASSWPLNYSGDGDWSLIDDWEILSTNPANGATNVPVTTLVAAALSTDIDPATVTTQTFTLSGTTGTVGYEDQTIVFAPNSDLAWNTQYTATITTGMADLYGNTLDANYSWTFTTAEQPGSSCVQVREGPWEFCLMNEGNCFLQFVDGDLTQTDCYVSYDDDAVFAGVLNDRTWSGENTTEQFMFSGTFSGTPAGTFSGTLTLTDGSGVSVPMIGQYGHLDITGQASRCDTSTSGAVRDLAEKLLSK